MMFTDKKKENDVKLINNEISSKISTESKNNNILNNASSVSTQPQQVVVDKKIDDKEDQGASFVSSVKNFFSNSYGHLKEFGNKFLELFQSKEKIGAKPKPVVPFRNTLDNNIAQENDFYGRAACEMNEEYEFLDIANPFGDFFKDNKDFLTFCKENNSSYKEYVARLNDAKDNRLLKKDAEFIFFVFAVISILIIVTYFFASCYVDIFRQERNEKIGFVVNDYRKTFRHNKRITNIFLYSGFVAFFVSVILLTVIIFQKNK